MTFIAELPDAHRSRRGSGWQCPFAGRSFALAAAIVGLPVVAPAQVTTDAARAPTLTVERYPENWSYLADPARRTGHWTEPFKYIPLSADGSIYLTTGLEARSYFEGYENVNWGSAKDDSYIWHRLLPYADLHIGNARLFVQPILSAISGAPRAKLPVDTTGIDMLQAFAEYETTVADRASLRLSAGRKMYFFGTGRLIDNRYGPNVPQAFDGVDATLASPVAQLTGLYIRPVDNEPGDFDDRASRSKALWGAYATQWLHEDRKTGFDAYYLGFQDSNAVFDQGSGREVIHTYGVRIFGDNGTAYWNFEGALQSGRFARHDVLAWGGGGQVGYRFLQTPMQPDVKLAVDVISGDDNPTDPQLGTFNPLFPRGKYYGALSPIGPRNLIHIGPGITIYPHKTVAVSLTGSAFWRQSLNDGIYAIPGNLVRSGTESRERFIGTQVELAVAWQATPELSLSAWAAAFEPGAFIRDTGPAETIKMLGLMANYRF